jgi:hypothetical protein
MSQWDVDACRCRHGDLRYVVIVMPLAHSLRSRDSGIFHILLPPWPSFGSPRTLWLHAKHIPVCGCVMSLISQPTEGCLRWPSHGGEGSPPTTAPRRRVSTPMSWTCDSCWALYWQCHPRKLGLKRSFSLQFCKKACSRYRRTPGCGGCVAIFACRPNCSWTLSFLRCVALSSLTMWY